MSAEWSGEDRGWRRHGLLVPSVIVLAWAFSLLPAFIDIVLDGRNAAPSIADVQTANPLASAIATLLSSAIIVLVALSLVSRRPPRRRRGGASLVLALAPWAGVVVANALAGVGEQRQIVLYPLLAVFIWREAPQVDVLRLVGPLVVVTATTSLAMAAVLPGAAFYGNNGLTSQVDKSFIGGRLLAGPFTHPNSLGGVLALGLPFVLQIRRRGWRLAGVTLVLTALVFSAARTSMVAAVAVLALYAIARLRLRLARPVFWALLAAGSVLLVATPLVTTQAEAFSQRGIIWINALPFWRAHPAFGSGATFFSQIGQIDNDLGPYAYTGHNLMIDTLVKFGLVGALLLVLAVGGVAFAVRSRSTGTVLGMTFLVAFVFEDWLEARVDLMNLGSFGFVLWIPLLVLICARSRGDLSPSGADDLTSPRSRIPDGVHERHGSSR